jgi:hypothetical protein
MNLIKLRNDNQQEKEQNDEFNNKRKIESLNLLFDYCNVTLDDVLKIYENAYFRNSEISKYDVFKQVMTNTLTKENKDYLFMIGNISNHQYDKRTPFGYCCDLIFGWLAEDTIRTVISSKNIKIVLNGSDNERDFLTFKELTTDPDMVIGEGENKRLLEIYCDWKDFWNENNKADLRDNKYVRLVKENALLFGVSPISKLGFLLDMSTESHGFAPSTIYTWNRKKGYTSRDIKKHMRPLDELFTELYEKFK